MTFRNLITLEAAGNIACCGPLYDVRANVVVELFAIYKVDYSSHNGSFWYSGQFHNIFLLKCSSYSSNITVKNYHSFWSYDKNVYQAISNKFSTSTLKKRTEHIRPELTINLGARCESVSLPVARADLSCPLLRMPIWRPFSAIDSTMMKLPVTAMRNFVSGPGIAGGGYMWEIYMK